LHGGISKGVAPFSDCYTIDNDLERLSARDQYWAELSDEIRGEAKRLYDRLVSLMGQVARTVRNAPLASEADERDVMAGTKTMRAAGIVTQMGFGRGTWWGRLSAAVLLPPSLPARGYPARDLAIPPIHTELPRR
jgi:hypothetical protein